MNPKNTHTSCLICESTALKALPGYEKDFLQQCQACGFVFSARIPTETELFDHYKGYPRNDDISPITIKRYHELLDSFEQYRQHNRIIDVGCGNGHFLKVARDRGWEVYGTEFTDEAMRECLKKDIRMQKGALNPDQYGPAFFDVVTSFEVLEHINNPREEMQRFRSVLRPGGLVYLTTPNFNSLSRYYVKQDWSIIEYPEHLSYYTAKTLRLLFDKSGFKTASIGATGISVGRLNHQKTPAQPAPPASQPEPSPAAADPSTFRTDDEKLRKRVEGNPLLKLAVQATNSALSTFKVGDTLKGFFVKK